MNKILVVLDDYSELTQCESTLKKLGFDALGIQVAKKVADTLLGFRPDVMIAMYKGRQIEGLKLFQGLRKTHPQCRTVLAVQSLNQLTELTEKDKFNVDAVMELPMTAGKLVPLVAELMKLDVAALVARYQKLTSMKISTEEGGVKFFNKGTMISEEQAAKRSERYKKFLESVNEKPTKTLSHDALDKRRKELEKASAGENQHLTQLLFEKKNFVKDLYILAKEKLKR